MRNLHRYSNISSAIKCVCLASLFGAVHATVLAKENNSTVGLVDTHVLLMAEVPQVELQLLLSQAQRLAADNAWTDLFVLLAPQERHHAGNFEFDRLLALSAARSGQNTRAVLALERALSSDPKDASLQAELATLYFQGGENNAALEIFESLRQTDLPNEVVGRVDQFLRALDDRQRQVREGFTPWVSVSTGYDSNVNAGTSQASILIPSLSNLPFTPSDSLKATGSSFTNTQLGLRWVNSLDNDTGVLNGCRLLIELTAQNMHYASADQYDQQGFSSDTSLGCPQNNRSREWIFGVVTQNTSLKGDALRNNQALRVQHLWNFSNVSQIALTAQSGKQIFQQDHDRDGTRQLINLGWASKLGDQERWLAGVNIAATQESPDFSIRKYQGYMGTQLQAHLRYRVNRDWAVQVFGSHEDRRHSEADSLYVTKRVDSDNLFALGLTYRTSQDSVLTMSHSLQSNKSNQSLYSFDRNITSLGWRYSF
jgi:tetratricopeptide (TPR) repeat protein